MAFITVSGSWRFLAGAGFDIIVIMMNRFDVISLFLLALVLVGQGGCSVSVSTREKSAIGRGGIEATTGAPIGLVPGQTGPGAVTRDAVGLGAGALIGDTLESQGKQRSRE